MCLKSIKNVFSFIICSRLVGSDSGSGLCSNLPKLHFLHSPTIYFGPLSTYHLGQQLLLLL